MRIIPRAVLRSYWDLVNAVNAISRQIKESTMGLQEQLRGISDQMSESQSVVQQVLEGFTTIDQRFQTMQSTIDQLKSQSTEGNVSPEVQQTVDTLAQQSADLNQALQQVVAREQAEFGSESQSQSSGSEGSF